ncbi:MULTISPECIES: ABC transporter ATP-binding protein [Myxococcus]|uniref:ATP-binding cassette domain-containing protein n=1 Tax=Myxococcus llanfairpwllgwyngyllgogerychwyrndrobwllllantysiliogogogochensis TaxID=2590453 RepID=A0A540X1Y3_9BACT|nr:MULTISPECIES: ATP-binding cassette domain-containing protein [Myxococcus]NTX07561.1 ATP-binding cassette domain-containing protein [Myxococcus sp. CA040A]NTX10760.1 ATP-binding cassette domain-containing protein [Myxococcus sp. CA056]TQF15272.1 ATP-binding cassette domain-containing protein [Myxococcus llanfairpwllgwyngyllgogerychwyrndrobwllllantysiliogogogochensis]
MSESGSQVAAKLAIEVKDLHKSFGDNAALRGANLVVPEGTTCVLMGVSGSGKSVLMKHLMGLMKPDRGSVKVNGEEVAELDEKALNQLRRQQGVLFQANALFDSFNVYDNVAFPLRERTEMSEDEIRQTVDKTLAMVGLSHATTRFPGELSGGMQKRVGFARAAILQPKILLYDDPTAGLDPLTTASVNEIIFTGKQQLGATSLVITPDVASAFGMADHLALMHEGRVVEYGPPDSFRESQHPAVKAFLNNYLRRRSQRVRAAEG